MTDSSSSVVQFWYYIYRFFKIKLLHRPRVVGFRNKYGYCSDIGLAHIWNEII